MLADLMQGGEIHLDQHWNDHDPNEQSHREIDLCDFKSAKGLECLRYGLSQANAHDNAQRHPEGEVALKDVHVDARR